jgi:hypothetical protein
MSLGEGFEDFLLTTLTWLSKVCHTDEKENQILPHI